ncbi:T9SS type A sorting domain-containing protein [Yeosuana sp. AK3]
MKTKLISFLLFTISYLGFSQTTSIPDANFEQALIDLGIDSDGIINGQILTIDAQSFNGILDVSNKNISDLKGIEAFTNIYGIQCQDNNLTSLDLSAIPFIYFVGCWNNQLTSINFGSNAVLSSLSCKNNLLPSLDVSNFSDLEFLQCYENLLSSLDVSNNTKLKELQCDSNQLTSLDLSQNTLLEYLYCSGNEISNFDFSNNPSLKKLVCSGNNLTSLDLSSNTSLSYLQCSSNELTSLDISSNPALTFFKSLNNMLLDLNIKNGNNTAINSNDFNVSNNPNLTCIQVDDINYSNTNWIQKDATASYALNCDTTPQTVNIPDNNFEQALIDLGIDSDGIVNTQTLLNDIQGITILNVSSKSISDLTGIESFTSLENLNCSSNQLSSLDLSNNEQIGFLDCSENLLTSLNLGLAPDLYYLICSKNLLTSLDVSNYANLDVLSCEDNKLTSLNVNITGLQLLYCQENLLTNLNLPNNSSLRVIFCDNNKLGSLDLSNCPQLEILNCFQNELTTINISNNLALEDLNCFSNQLTSLDISNNTQLDFLSCSDNNLSDINVLNNTLLETLACGGNNISDLDVGQNPLLGFLLCENNQLTNIEISNNKALTTFWCNNNQITSLDLSNHALLYDVNCSNNQLTFLNIKNGNNTTITGSSEFNDLNALNNPNLTCITVDNATYSTTNWTNIDAQTSFSEDCGIVWSSDSSDYSNFSATNSDSDAFTWETENGNVTAKGLVTGTSFFSKSYDDIAGALTPDNLLITPSGAITIPNNASSISFKLNVEASNSDRPAENFAVYVFDEAIGQSLDNKIYEETLTVGGTGTAKDITATIPTSFAGKTIGIIIRHYNTTGQDKLYVDNFEVSYEASTLSLSEPFVQSFSLYPNPTKNIVYLSIAQESYFTLTNINGQVLNKGRLFKGNSNVDLSLLNNGMYFFSFQSSNGIITKKIIKK